MPTFDELVESRKRWIDEVLQPWCRGAPRRELLKAEQEWGDIAGRVDPAATLWTWAWSRFPELVHDALTGVDETTPVRVELASGATFEGFPDGRRSERGELHLVTDSGDAGPFSLDEIASVQRLGERRA